MAPIMLAFLILILFLILFYNIHVSVKSNIISAVYYLMILFLSVYHTLPFKICL